MAPDAPENVPGAPMGYQWFPIPWMDGSSEEEAERSMMQSVEDLNAFLDALMVDEDVLPEQVVLFGFSQGTMMSLYVAPRREDEVAGIVAFSGRLLKPELLSDETVSRPPVLLVHGDLRLQVRALLRSIPVDFRLPEFLQSGQISLSLCGFSFAKTPLDPLHHLRS